ncbi:MAG: hypothetical protein E6R03_10755 [Hyphomicrobiaceae bacterium]|nr:MAG: hypothetical protein E6R03_10755 [Hyphomicrobiaceae bacterium]
MLKILKTPYGSSVKTLLKTLLQPHQEYLVDESVETYLDNMSPVVIIVQEDVFLFEERYPKTFVGHYFCKSRGSVALINAKVALAEMMEKASLILGFTPTNNKPARLFARKLGFKSNGMIDTAFGEAEFFSMTKQEWNEKYG